MQLLNIIRKKYLFLLLMLPFYLFASERTLLEINASSEGINKKYTLEALLTLPQYDVQTKLPWTQEAHIYSGPYLKDVLQSAKVEGGQLTLEALDYYSVSLDFQKIAKFNPILALKKDGKALTIRSKGPIWLILPIDDYPQLNAAIYNDYMVWHLVKISVAAKEGN